MSDEKSFSDGFDAGQNEAISYYWQTASEDDCCKALYQIGGALRRAGKIDLALDAEKIANALYPGKIKPAPIVPRTTT